MENTDRVHLAVQVDSMAKVFSNFLKFSLLTAVAFNFFLGK